MLALFQARASALYIQSCIQNEEAKNEGRPQPTRLHCMLHDWSTPLQEQAHALEKRLGHILQLLPHPSQGVYGGK